MTPLLVLFDVDGTLFLTHDPLAGRALRETLTERFRVELPEDALERVDHEGQTSLRIGRLVLRDAGLDAPELGPWCAEFAKRYLELLSEADTSDWQAASGAEESLARLQAAGQRLALLKQLLGTHGCRDRIQDDADTLGQLIQERDVNIRQFMERG